MFSGKSLVPEVGNFGSGNPIHSRGALFLTQYENAFDAYACVLDLETEPMCRRLFIFYGVSRRPCSSLSRHSPAEEKCGVPREKVARNNPSRRVEIVGGSRERTIVYTGAGDQLLGRATCALTARPEITRPDWFFEPGAGFSLLLPSELFPAAHALSRRTDFGEQETEKALRHSPLPPFPHYLPAYRADNSFRIYSGPHLENKSWARDSDARVCDRTRVRFTRSKCKKTSGDGTATTPGVEY